MPGYSHGAQAARLLRVLPPDECSDVWKVAEPDSPALVSHPAQQGSSQLLLQERLRKRLSGLQRSPLQAGAHSGFWAPQYHAVTLGNAMTGSAHFVVTASLDAHNIAACCCGLDTQTALQRQRLPAGRLREG